MSIINNSVEFIIVLIFKVYLFIQAVGGELSSALKTHTMPLTTAATQIWAPHDNQTGQSVQIYSYVHGIIDDKS